MVTGKEFRIRTREKFISLLPESSCCVIFSGSPKQVTNDDDYRFFADLNFQYLTGLDREDMVYVVRKKDGQINEMIFAPEKDSLKERWHGKRLAEYEIREVTGIDKVMAADDFKAWLVDTMSDDSIKILTDLTSVAPEKDSLGDKAEDISRILTDMRIIKDPYEISCLREAARITEEAVESLKDYIKEGMTEYELAMRLDYELARRSCPVFSFATIVAVDGNSFYLHHSRADRDVKVTKGGYIQIDCGARFDGYSADISRVIFTGGADPDSDKSDKRYVLHGIIKELRKEATAFIRPGVTFAQLNARMHEVSIKRLMELGLIKEDEDQANAVKRYYWHNTSHFLGLNVHDVGSKERAFEEGMTLAVEPGLYIPEWQVGFRIEDDVLVTGEGCEYLSSGRDDIGEAYICI